MISRGDIAQIGARLAARAGDAPPAVYDIRIDAEGLEACDDPALGSST